MPSASVNGIDLFYIDEGAGPPILFHHGYADSHEVWLDVIERLRDRFRCIALDCRGTGQSARPPAGYDVPQYAADVVGLTDALRLERIAYVGHSLGGMVGFELGLEHAQRLDRLVLVGAAPANGLTVPAAIHEHRRRLRAEQARDEAIWERRAAAARSVNEAKIARAVDTSFAVSDSHFEETVRTIQDYRVADRLAEIETPTLVVSAAADPLLPVHLKDFRRLGNATLHVFSRVSHDVAQEVPAAFSRVLADFMQHGVVTAATLQARAEEAATPTG